jgi:hypothetical protein
MEHLRRRMEEQPDGAIVMDREEYGICRPMAETPWPQIRLECEYRRTCLRRWAETEFAMALGK